MNGFWTPARELELAALVAEGRSASQAAAVLGCSRNAVIGKVLRGEGRFGKLSGRPCRGPRAEMRPRRRKRVVAAPRLVPPDIPAVPAPPPVPPSVAPISFLQAVDEERCLWFAGEAYGPDGPDMPVCGAPRADVPATRYCAYHRYRQQDRAAA